MNYIDLKYSLIGAVGVAIFAAVATLALYVLGI